MNNTTIIVIALAFLAGTIFGLLVDKRWMPKFMDMPAADDLSNGLIERVKQLEQWLLCRDRTIAGYDKQLKEKDATIRVLQEQHNKDHAAIVSAATMLKERADA